MTGNQAGTAQQTISNAADRLNAGSYPRTSGATSSAPHTIKLPSNEHCSPQPGDDVIGSCGHKVGEVVDVEPGYIVVEVGFFHPSDLYVPTSAIDTQRNDDVHLNLTKDQALHQGWDEEPAS